MAVIAVTGSAGLLGRAVMDQLRAEGHSPRGIDWPGRDERDTVMVDLRHADRAKAALDGCESIIHLAGFPRAGSTAPAEVFGTNTAISFAVAQAAVDLGVKTVAYASSVSVIGYPFYVRPLVPKILPVTEAEESVAQDAYGLSKAVGEHIITAAVARSGGTLSAVSLRLPWLQTPDTFWAEVPPVTADGMDARNLFAYIDTRDAAAALTAIVARPNEGHHRFFFAALDTFSDRPSAELASHWFPSSALSRTLTGDSSLIDSSAAIDYLGYKPRHSWRSYPQPGRS